MSEVDRGAPLIVIEGIDGSGKGTQSALLNQRLNAAGITSTLLSFPRYQSTFFGARIGEFLNGQFGALNELHPFLVSLLYAGDRYESRDLLLASRQSSQAVVLDRYVPSNIAHQSAKVQGAERAQLQTWIEQVEYGLFHLPKPDLVILLDVPVDSSQELIRRKEKRTYTDRATDLQESDTSYMGAVREAYLSLAEQSPEWRVVPVTEEGQVRPVETIADDIWQLVQPVLRLKEK
ncbi:dTMP kinase [Planctomicrobium piriforme]|uniref:Thymidylate kinase n=1 Tax=Planctomicrobium piriforme TaxID=1576369 RepID=A0A1I3BH51_9PLAN|nr:dTMP kinase [Planctomicrobium piriforme]SFH61617.1 dTMP kinase [Planctomicrobium piriforme]